MATTGKTCMVQGRIVWVSGDLFKGQRQVDYNTKAPKVNAQGEPVIQYGFGLAVPKSVLSQTADGQPGAFWRAMHEEAYSLYPNGHIPPSFAMKYKDGDGVDDKGISFTQRKGYAGNVVLACTTNLPIKFFRWENGQNIQINEGIKCGDYVNVQLNIKAHPAQGQGKPGLYLNPYAVQFLGFGEEIINTPSGDQIFGTAMPPIPTGASATPIAPQGLIMPQPVAAPAAPAQPHYGVLPPQFQQQMGNVPVQPVAPQPMNTVPQPLPTQSFAQPASPSNGFPSFPMR